MIIGGTTTGAANSAPEAARARAGAVETPLEGRTAAGGGPGQGRCRRLSAYISPAETRMRTRTRTRTRTRMTSSEVAEMYAKTADTLARY